MQKKYIKVDQVIEITGLARDTIYQYTYQKRLPFLKMGRMIRFDETAVHEWMENQLTTG